MICHKKAASKPCPSTPCPSNPCHAPCPESCGCVTAVAKSAESAASSATAAAKSAELAQTLLKNCLTDSTIEPGGGLLPSEDGHGIKVDETWIDARSLQPKDIEAGQGIEVETEADKVTVSAKIGNGLGFDEDGKLVVNFNSLTTEEIKKYFNNFFPKLGEGLYLDSNGKLAVDFSKMPQAKFENILRQLKVPIFLTAKKSVYVDADALEDIDDNEERRSEIGTQEHPWKNFQKAYNYYSQYYNLGTYNLIFYAKGTFKAQTWGGINTNTGYIEVRPWGDAPLKFSDTPSDYGRVQKHTLLVTGNTNVHVYNLEFEMIIKGANHVYQQIVALENNARLDIGEGTVLRIVVKNENLSTSESDYYKPCPQVGYINIRKGSCSIYSPVKTSTKDTLTCILEGANLVSTQDIPLYVLYNNGNFYLDVQPTSKETSHVWIALQGFNDSPSSGMSTSHFYSGHGNSVISCSPNYEFPASVFSGDFPGLKYKLDGAATVNSLGKGANFFPGSVAGSPVPGSSQLLAYT